MEQGLALRFQDQSARTIRVSVNPRMDYRKVLRTLEAIEMPPLRVSHDRVRFAVLELLNNSIRAHRERQETRDIRIDMTLSNGSLAISIRDFGGGFDPGRLPYNLAADPSTVDIQAEPFQRYQEQNDYKRFGMGLYVAKKTFESFRLVFLDAQDRVVAWESGRVVGTLVVTSIGTVLAEASACSEPVHGR
jgi:anti-sigma regulatory factor (Ser/Thr protein kinase)